MAGAFQSGAFQRIAYQQVAATPASIEVRPIMVVESPRARMGITTTVIAGEHDLLIETSVRK